MTKLHLVQKYLDIAAEKKAEADKIIMERPVGLGIELKSYDEYLEDKVEVLLRTIEIQSKTIEGLKKDKERLCRG